MGKKKSGVDQNASGSGEAAPRLPKEAVSSNGIEMTNAGKKKKKNFDDIIDLTPTANPAFPPPTPPRFCEGGLFGEGEIFDIPEEPTPFFDRPYVKFSVLLTILFAILAAAKPSVSSFEDVRLFYNKPAPPPSLDEPYHWLFSDPTFAAKPRQTHASDHGTFSLGYMSLSPRSTNRRYEHWFVGVLGQWFQLPFMPRPGKRNFDTNTVAVGLCAGGYCMVVPNPKKVSVPKWVPYFGEKYGAKSADQKKKKKKEKRDSTDKKSYHDSVWAHAGDWLTFRDHMDVWINVLMLPTVILTLGWQWMAWWPFMYKNCSLSANNFKHWRLWTLFIAPFAHRDIFSAVFNFLAVTHFASGFFSSDSSFMFLLFIYLVSSWIYWFVTMVSGELIFKDKDAKHFEGYGATGAVTALLAFMAFERPGEPMSFSLYMIRAPVKLLPLFAMPLHIVMAFITGKQPPGSIFGHIAAAVFGGYCCLMWKEYSGLNADYTEFFKAPFVGVPLFKGILF